MEKCDEEEVIQTALKSKEFKQQVYGVMKDIRIDYDTAYSELLSAFYERLINKKTKPELKIITRDIVFARKTVAGREWTKLNEPKEDIADYSDKLCGDDSEYTSDDFTKLDIANVIDNAEKLFTKPSAAFIKTLLYYGVEDTKELLNINTGEVNRRLKNIEKYIIKHHDKFNSIKTTKQKCVEKNIKNIEDFLKSIDKRESFFIDKNMMWVSYCLEFVANEDNIFKYWDKTLAHEDNYQFINRAIEWRKMNGSENTTKYR